MEQTDFDVFVAEQEKLEVEVAIVNFRKKKAELGRDKFVSLMKNSEAWFKGYERYEDFLFKEIEEKNK